ncbi:hypothetical protein [Paludisphaera rhizosphaerae]|uniref:hypothetical protein n=1 Tax=Paludisphaera rhizosphaerae TaxID=2711216 RepID=UPI0013EB3A8D|nr:hypothetical protein [Paludisphaera rhizosphaerae]
MDRTLAQRWRASAAAMVLAAFTGCGEGGAPGVGVATYPASGKVLKGDGSPLPGGIVTFVPGDEKAMKASGPIAADGSFTLNTDGIAPGAPAGEYRVRVELDPDGASAGPGARRAAPFPAKYVRESTSQLTATVKADAPNEFTFTLK